MNFPSAIAWLSHQKEYPQFFWSDRKKTIAACGAKETFSSLPLQEELVVGGLCFSPPSSLWNPFPPSFFFTPKRLFHGEEVLFPENGREKILSSSHFPEKPHWKELVSSALSEIKKDSFSKVVLARRTEFLLSHSPSPWSLLLRLAEEVSEGTLFGLRLDAETAFFGITPETLFRREGTDFFTEAIAGTRKSGEEADLLSSKKEEREFSSVSDFLEETLSSLCTFYQIGQKKVRKAGPLLHLCREFRGKLRDGISDRELLLACHPTPAVGGRPREEALSFLREQELVERGWYAGAIGFATKERSQFSVGIRSALLKKNQLHLFAGTGIVEGSKPKKEWEELGTKIAPYQKIFQ